MTAAVVSKPSQSLIGAKTGVQLGPSRPLRVASFARCADLDGEVTSEAPSSDRISESVPAVRWLVCIDGLVPPTSGPT